MDTCPICRAELNTKKVFGIKTWYCGQHLFKDVGKCRAKLPETGFTCDAKLFESLTGPTKGNWYCVNGHVFAADKQSSPDVGPVYIKMRPSALDSKVRIQAPKSRLDRTEFKENPKGIKGAFGALAKIEENLLYTDSDEELEKLINEQKMSGIYERTVPTIIYNGAHPYEKYSEKIANDVAKHFRIMHFNVFPASQPHPFSSVQVTKEPIILEISCPGILETGGRSLLGKVLVNGKLENVLEYVVKNYPVQLLTSGYFGSVYIVQYTYDKSQISMDTLDIGSGGKWLENPLGLNDKNSDEIHLDNPGANWLKSPKGQSDSRLPNILLCPKCNKLVKAVPTPDGETLMCPYCFHLFGKRFKRKLFEGFLNGGWLKSAWKKTEKLNGVNWVDIAPKFMILILGMFLFSWELITFGGGDFGGDFWIFAIFGTILGLISLVYDYFDKKEEEKEEDEKMKKIKKTIAPEKESGETPNEDEEENETEDEGLSEDEKEEAKERRELAKQRGVSKAEIEEEEEKKIND